MWAAGIPSESSPSGVTRAITRATAGSARLASLNSASPASPRNRAIAAQNRTLNFASSGLPPDARDDRRRPGDPRVRQVAGRVVLGAVLRELPALAEVHGRAAEIGNAE